MAVSESVHNEMSMEKKPSSIFNNAVKDAMEKYTSCAEASNLIFELEEAEKKLKEAETTSHCFFISGCFCQSAYDEDEDGNCVTSDICSYCQGESKIEDLKKKILNIYEMCRNFIKKNK